MGIDKRSIPDCVSAAFFLTRVNRVNFVVIPTSKLNCEELWFGLIHALVYCRKNFKSTVGSQTFDTACMPVRTQHVKVCESSVKKHGEHREKH